MNILIQFLPIITSIIIAILFFVIKLWIKKQFTISIEKEKIILENQYKILFDEKINLNKKLEILNDNFIGLDGLLTENHNDPLIKEKIESFYFNILQIKNKISLYCCKEFKTFIDRLFNFPNGIEYIKYFKLKKSEYLEFKTEFQNILKNERNN